MQILSDVLPKELVSIVEEYAKDRTLSNKVLQQLSILQFMFTGLYRIDRPKRFDAMALLNHLRWIKKNQCLIEHIWPENDLKNSHSEMFQNK